MTSPAAPQPPAYGAPSLPSPLSPADEKLWATLIHVGALFFNFLVPLIGYLVLKDRGPFVRAHAATALNFQLTLLIAYAVGSILTVVLIGFFILAAVWVLNVVFCIVAAVKANRGDWYRYPLTITFVS